MKNPDKFEETVVFLADKLKNLQYTFRGTSSLVLQDFDMNVDDVDILTDKNTAIACNRLLKEYLVEKVKFKESEKFKSYFGKFKINGIDIEIMGEWQIKDPKGNWSEVYNASESEVTKVNIEDKEVSVTTVETELSMYAKMGRWNAYYKIKRQIGTVGSQLMRM